VWKQIFEWSRGILFLTRDVAELQAEMKEVRAELRESQLRINELVHSLNSKANASDSSERSWLWQWRMPFFEFNAGSHHLQKENK
jgi:hypothetical protein